MPFRLTVFDKTGTPLPNLFENDLLRLCALFTSAATPPPPPSSTSLPVKQHQVFHSASGDLEHLSAAGARVAPFTVRDTASYRFPGSNQPGSLAAYLDHFAIKHHSPELPKDKKTRFFEFHSKWSMRPLSSDHLRYSAEDAAHLTRLWAAIMSSRKWPFPRVMLRVFQNAHHDQGLPWPEHQNLVGCLQQMSKDRKHWVRQPRLQLVQKMLNKLQGATGARSSLLRTTLTRLFSITLRDATIDDAHRTPLQHLCSSTFKHYGYPPSRVQIESVLREIQSACQRCGSDPNTVAAELSRKLDCKSSLDVERLVLFTKRYTREPCLTTTMRDVKPRGRAPRATVVTQPSLTQAAPTPASPKASAQLHRERLAQYARNGNIFKRGRGGLSLRFEGIKSLPAEPNGTPAQVQVFVKNTSDQDRKLCYWDVLNRPGHLALDDDRHVHALEQPTIIRAHSSYILRLIYRPKNAETIRTSIILRFASFVVGKRMILSASSREAQQMSEAAAPYQGRPQKSKERKAKSPVESEGERITGGLRWLLEADPCFSLLSLRAPNPLFSYPQCSLYHLFFFLCVSGPGQMAFCHQFKEYAIPKDTNIAKEAEDAIAAKSYVKQFHSLLWLEEIGQRNHLRMYDMEDAAFKSKGGQLLWLGIPGLAESRPSVMRQDRVISEFRGLPSRHLGYVHEVTRDEIGVHFSHRVRNSFVQGMRATLELQLTRTSLVRKHLALDSISLGLHILLQTGGSVLPGRPKEVKFALHRSSALNAEQMQAVHTILKLQPGDAPFIIFGPPGTGKTTTAAEAAYQVRGSGGREEFRGRGYHLHHFLISFARISSPLLLTTCLCSPRASPTCCAHRYYRPTQRQRFFSARRPTPPQMKALAASLGCSVPALCRAGIAGLSAPMLSFARSMRPPLPAAKIHLTRGASPWEACLSLLSIIPPFASLRPP